MWLPLALSLSPSVQEPDSWLDLFQRAERAQAENDSEGTQRWLRAALATDPENATVAYHLAAHHARAGATDETLAWLERAVGWGHADDAVIEWDEDFAALRDEPRFLEVVRTAAAIATQEPDADIHWQFPGEYEALVTPDGRRALLRGETALLWDPVAGELIAVLDGTSGRLDLALDPAGEAVVGVEGMGVIERPRVRCWEIADGRRRWDVVLPPGLGNLLRSTALFTADGTGVVLVGSRSRFRLSMDDGAVSKIPFLDLARAVEAREWTTFEPPGVASRSRCLTPVDDQRIAFVTGDDELHVMSVDSGDLLSRHRMGVGYIHSITRCGSLLVADGEGRTAFLDLEGTGTAWSVPGGCSLPSKDGEQLLVQHETSSRILDPAGRVPARELPVGGRISAAAWSCNENHLAIATGSRVRIWDVEAMEVCAGPLDHQDTVYGLDFEPDGRRLASGCASNPGGSEPQLRIWDVATGEQVGAVNAPEMMFGVGTVLFADDGSFLLCVMGGIPDIEARHPETLDLLWAHRGFSGGPNWLRLEPTAAGRLFAGGGYESRVLDLTDGSLIHAYDDDVIELLPSPDEQRIFTTRDGGVVVLDGTTLDVLVTRVEYPDGGGLVFLSSLYCRGTPDALELSWLVIEGRASRLADWAERLYDPKRVAAGAAGVRVRAPALH